MSPTTVFKRSATIRPMTLGGSSGSGSDPDHVRGVTYNSKNTLVGSANQPKSRNSGGINNNIVTRGGGVLPTKERGHSEGRGSNDSVYIRKQKKKQACKIIFYNLYETILLILLLLNSVAYPNFGTAIYFLYTLFLTALCLSKDERKIKIK